MALLVLVGCGTSAARKTAKQPKVKHLQLIYHNSRVSIRMSRLRISVQLSLPNR